MTQDKIKEVEKGCGMNLYGITCGSVNIKTNKPLLCKSCQATLKTLKSCSEEQTAKVEKLKEEIDIIRRWR